MLARGSPRRSSSVKNAASRCAPPAPDLPLEPREYGAQQPRCLLIDVIGTFVTRTASACSRPTGTAATPSSARSGGATLGCRSCMPTTTVASGTRTSRGSFTKLWSRASRAGSSKQWRRTTATSSSSSLLGFDATPLESILREGLGVDELLVAGTATEMCVFETGHGRAPTRPPGLVQADLRDRRRGARAARARLPRAGAWRRDPPYRADPVLVRLPHEDEAGATEGELHGAAATLFRRRGRRSPPSWSTESSTRKPSWSGCGATWCSSRRAQARDHLLIAALGGVARQSWPTSS